MTARGRAAHPDYQRQPNQRGHSYNYPNPHQRNLSGYGVPPRRLAINCANSAVRFNNAR
jgi:hypothetical protein